ncbi:MAG: HAMP domain-containing protein [Candidatus Marinimicrobia bacterium]|nr:HAMP domain-containing protein [Candidatus Neomarinimicrobiota bacterium]
MKNKFKISISLKFAFSFAILFLIAMTLIVFAVRKAVVNQFSEIHRTNMESTVAAIESEVTNQHLLIYKQLAELANKIQTDDQLLLQTNMLSNIYVPYLVDYAQNFMATMGFQSLEIINNDGVVLSSGHYRNAFGADHQMLVNNLKANIASANLARFSRADGQFICLTAMDSLTVANQVLYVVGGVEVTETFLGDLEPTTDDILAIRFSNELLSSGGSGLSDEEILTIIADTTQAIQQNILRNEYSTRKFTLPFVTETAQLNASFNLLRPTAELTLMLSDLNRFIMIIAAGVILIAIFVSVWRTNAVTKPLQRLANTASNLSLDTLNVNFEVDSNDEVGVLNEALQKMVERLRMSRMKLARAEQRAALTEITRQVNHDIKNGFIPIRNVMSHWEEVEENEPHNLPKIFAERKSTVTESLDYLESLTRNYSRLQPEVNLGKVSINEIIRNLLQMYRTFPDMQLNVQTDLTDEEPRVLADSVQLRRAFENIFRNALDAIDDTGEIFVSSSIDDDRVIIRWVDNGEGIPEHIQAQLFRTPITTKSTGTGIGLANVRRIIEDFDGTITLSSTEGEGTMVTIALPVINESMNDRIE